MSRIDDRMEKDIEEKPSRAEGDWNTQQEMQQNAFERLGKDSVIIETLVIMNIVFAVFTFSLIGVLAYMFKNK